MCMLRPFFIYDSVKNSNLLLAAEMCMEENEDNAGSSVKESNITPLTIDFLERQEFDELC